MDENGEAIAKISAPSALRGLEGGKTIPASAFFDGKSDFTNVSVTVNWARFEEPNEGDSAQIVLENISTRIDGLTAQIGGAITADKAEGKADVTLVAAAFNAQGEVIGIRRQDSAIPANTPVEFTIPVFSSGGPIAEVELYAELIEGIAE